MTDLFRGREAESVPWIWRWVIPGMWRYALANDDGILRIGTPDELVRRALDVEYESQVLAEMLDPEWPNEYWERQLEMQEA